MLIEIFTTASYSTPQEPAKLGTLRLTVNLPPPLDQLHEPIDMIDAASILLREANSKAGARRAVHQAVDLMLVAEDIMFKAQSWASGMRDPLPALFALKAAAEKCSPLVTGSHARQMLDIIRGWASGPFNPAGETRHAH